MIRAPAPARLLGLAGLLPQIAFCAAAYILRGEEETAAQTLALTYAALIFTFIGGTWWGLIASSPAAGRRDKSGYAWGFAVLPSLLALGLLGSVLVDALPIEAALVSLGGGIMFSPLVDARLKAYGPPWWMGLRLPLSLGLGVLTIVTAFV